MPDLFGNRLKALRCERGMSQEELAQLLGTSKQVISRYETNQRTPKITVVNEYAIKLNVPLAYLLGESSETEKFTANNSDELSTLVHEFADTIKQLSDSDKDLLIAMMRSLREKNGPVG